MIQTLLVRNSQNAKTGPVALATYRTQVSCPGDCPLMGSGCYAENNGVGGSQSPFGHAGRGTILDDDYSPLIDAIASLRPARMVRFNVAGDYLLEDGTPDLGYIEATNHAHRQSVLSYTHAWRRLDPKMFHPNTRPNASCDSVEGIREAVEAGWAAVIVDPGDLYPQGAELAPGHKAVTCPYETSKRQCVDCGLCARGKRPSVVVFSAHGARRKVASNKILEVIQA